MLVVVGLKEVEYPKGKEPKDKDHYEIDVIFKESNSMLRETVRVPYFVLKELYNSVKEEKQ